MGGRLGARQEPSYHSGRHHHKVRPTSPTTSNLRPSRKARKRPTRIFCAEKILISLQTVGRPQHREACGRFFCKARRANSKIKGGGGAMAAWECSWGVTGAHYHPNCTVGQLHSFVTKLHRRFPIKRLERLRWSSRRLGCSDCKAKFYFEKFYFAKLWAQTAGFHVNVCMRVDVFGCHYVNIFSCSFMIIYSWIENLAGWLLAPALVGKMCACD